MKNIFLKLSIFLIINALSFNLFSQEKLDFLKKTFFESQSFFNKGDFNSAEKNLKFLIANKEYIPESNMIAVYNLYGRLDNKLGRYYEAIENYKRSIDFFNSSEEKESKKLFGLYNNIALVYKNLVLYEKSNLYFDNALYILNDISDSVFVRQRKSRILYNKGILEYNRENYHKAINLFKGSLNLEKKYNLNDIDKVYYNLARSHSKLDDDSNAEKFYLLSIDNRKKIYGNDYFNLAPLYLNYGVFLNKIKKSEKALNYIRSSVNLYVQTYGKNHPVTAFSLRHFGDYYLSHEKFDSALYYYQRSLIANSNIFNSIDPLKNPETDDVISWKEYLASLKMKSVCFQSMYFQKDKDRRYIFLSNKLNESAIEYISKLSSANISDESKFIITETGKAFYSLAIENYTELYEVTGDNFYLEMAYHHAYRSKAAVLEEQILKEAQIQQELPEEVLRVKNKAEGKIDSYKRLIFEETSNFKPDKKKISIWQSELLDLNIKYENFINILKKEYPAYEENLRLVKNLSVNDLQKRISSKDIIAEYFIGTNTFLKDTSLFIFVITKTKIFLRKLKIDHVFFQNIDFVTRKMNNYHSEVNDLESYNRINLSLNELYKVLIKPVNEFLDSKNLIIIPDQEIALLSFETLLSEYTEQNVINYTSLSFLIHDFAISYAYSASLLYEKHNSDYNEFVYGFAPEYKNNDASSSGLYNLSGAVKEIESILKWIEGSNIMGLDANRKLFDSISKEKSIIHFAMHASVDKDQPDFSYLAFSNAGEDSTGIVYNYEIEVMDISSPLVVLSACNTGSGEIYNGEGIMSLTRSFLHAGVPSVVHSLWNINDQTGMKIMEDFYKFLSKGYSKSDALRKAKLNYLDDASPSAGNPYYWAGYVITGDRSPVIKKSMNLIIVGFFLILIVISYFSVRKFTKNRT